MRSFTRVILAASLAVVALASVACGGPEVQQTPARVVVEATPTATPVGLSRSEPVPRGETALADDGVALTVANVMRGQEAWLLIRSFNVYNPQPSKGSEYLLVDVRVEFRGSANETISIPHYNFRIVGQSGVIHTADGSVAVAEFPELFGGGSARGQVVFRLPAGETELTLIYDSGLGTTARYLSLE